MKEEIDFEGVRVAQRDYVGVQYNIGRMPSPRRQHPSLVADPPPLLVETRGSLQWDRFLIGLNLVMLVAISWLQFHTNVPAPNAAIRTAIYLALVTLSAVALWLASNKWGTRRFLLGDRARRK